jgi:hypothetical protein
MPHTTPQAPKPGKEAESIDALIALADQAAAQAEMLMEAGNGSTELHKAMRYGAMALQAKAEGMRSQVRCLHNIYKVTRPAAQSSLSADLAAIAQAAGVDSAEQTTVILCAPAGYGKTRIAEKLKGLFSCTRIVDEWDPAQPLQHGALHVTNSTPSKVTQHHEVDGVNVRLVNRPAVGLGAFA